MLYLLRKQLRPIRAESGFVLVLSMVILLLLTLFGLWALRTSDLEIKVASSSQQIENQFNIAEGSANTEAGNVGFFLKKFYEISNPNSLNQLLTPDTDALFDPGNDTANTLASISASDQTTWPWDNLLADYTAPPNSNDIYDYRYLVTYLYPDTPPMGYDATSFSGYKFRIQGEANVAPAFVELGGTKVGPK